MYRSKRYIEDFKSIRSIYVKSARDKRSRKLCTIYVNNVDKMATRRRPIHSTPKMNFRPSNLDANLDQTGTKPTSDPTSVKEIFTLMILYVCKKSLFFDTNLKVALYLGALFIVSLIADVANIPKSYMSRSDNFLNKYFVKFAWGWNLALLLPFVCITAHIYCCGQKPKVLRNHLSRLGIATFFWWFWTTLFNFVEASYGRCSSKSLSTRTKCLSAGFMWNGFDLSGHSFILIYGSLVLIEETRCMVNWDSIKDHIRLEEHYRYSNSKEVSTNPLRYLSFQELKKLQEHYEKFTPYIRSLFIVITLFQIMWDVMLICTMLYYHVMAEKFLGGAIAILTWFVTYRIWYCQSKILPSLPGDGVFKYMKPRSTKETLPASKRRTNSIVNNSQIPTFMGMPLYAQNSNAQQQNAQEEPAR